MAGRNHREQMIRENLRRVKPATSFGKAVVLEGNSWGNPEFQHQMNERKEHKEKDMIAPRYSGGGLL